MTNPRRPPLAQARRRHLVVHVKKRGQQNYNIWYAFCPGTHTDVVLLSDLRYELFLATEGDHEVLEANHEPPDVLVRIDGVSYDVSFDVVARFADGHQECRDVTSASSRPSEAHLSPSLRLVLKQKAAERMGAQYVQFTEEMLDVVHLRVRNWARAIAALGRCRDRNLELIESALVARLHDGQQTSIGLLLATFADESPALVVAAIVSLLRKRVLASDLDTQTWGTQTQVWASGGGA